MNQELDRFLNRIWFCMEYSGRSGDETKPQWWISHETLFRWYRCMRKVVTKPQKVKKFEIMTFHGDYTRELLERNFTNWHIRLKRKVKGSRLWMLDFAPTAEAGIGESLIRIRFVHLHKSAYRWLENTNPPYGVQKINPTVLNGRPVRVEWPGTSREVYVPLNKGLLLEKWYGENFYEPQIEKKIDYKFLTESHHVDIDVASATVRINKNHRIKLTDNLKQYESGNNHRRVA